MDAMDAIWWVAIVLAVLMGSGGVLASLYSGEWRNKRDR